MSTVYHTLPDCHSGKAATGTAVVLAPYSGQHTPTYWAGLDTIRTRFSQLTLWPCPHEVPRDWQFPVFWAARASSALTHVFIITDAAGTVGAGLYSLLRMLAAAPVAVYAVMPDGVIYMHIRLMRTAPRNGQARYMVAPIWLPDRADRMRAARVHAARMHAAADAPSIRAAAADAAAIRAAAIRAAEVRAAAARADVAADAAADAAAVGGALVQGGV